MDSGQLPEPSKIKASPMRMVLCYSPRWDGVLPGVVVRVHDDQSVNIFVFGDDQLLSPFHFSQMVGAQVFDALTDEQRSAMHEHDPIRGWAEWNTHQVGQAAKTEDVAAKLAARVQELESYIANATRQEPKPFAPSFC